MLGGWLVGIVSCGGTAERSFPLAGEVVEVRADGQLVVAHDAVPGFMDPMTMPFRVAPPLPPSLGPGDRIEARLVVGESASLLTDVRIVREAPPAEGGPGPRPSGSAVAEGAPFPKTDVVLAQGPPITIGQGQTCGTVVTFVYTRCPVPEACPLVVSKLAGLQEVLPDHARIVAITLDPDHDTRSVLRAFGEEVGAIPGRWDFGRVPGEVLFGLAEKAGLRVDGRVPMITHDLVLLVLDDRGRLVKRFRDAAWDRDEIAALLAPPR